MERRTLEEEEESERGNRALVSRATASHECLVDSTRRLTFSRKRSREGPQGEAQVKRPRLQGSVISPHRVHNQPQQCTSSNPFALRSSARFIGSRVAGPPPYVNEFVARGPLFRPLPHPLAHSKKETADKGGRHPQPTSPQFIDLTGGSPKAESLPQMSMAQSSSEELTTHGSSPGSPVLEGTETLVREFEKYKLETKFYEGYVVHRTCKLGGLSSSKSWEESRWNIRKGIGTGSFGTVSLQKKEGGEGEGGEQLRAVKMISRKSLKKGCQSQELLALVELKGYNHLFVDFLGWYEDPDHTFLVMEYIEYGDLSKYIKDQRVKAGVNEITRQILEGLEVLHGKEIYHRDLKPQNILMASLDPIWVKITDFGGSKGAKNTAIRTLVGTAGYCAPEILRLTPRKFTAGGFIPHALDIWSLGSLLHKLLTLETPFNAGLDLGPTLSTESGLSAHPGSPAEISETPFKEELDLGSGLSAPLGSQAESLSERGTDQGSLYQYCNGITEFPTAILQRSQLDEKGIAFIKRLLVANPKYRPTAAQALQDPWLIGYTSDRVENLRKEFSCLGVDLELGGVLGRQVGKGDIMRFLPSSAKENISSLLQRAVAEGCNSVISRLFESPSYSLGSMDILTRGKLFQLAAEARQLDTIKLLLEHKVNIGVFPSGETVLQCMVNAGDTNTVNLLLEDVADAKTNNDCKEGLLLAIKSGNVDMVRVFLTNKVDNIDALQLAARRGYTSIVKLLLKNKTDIDAEPVPGDVQTALQAAARGGHIEAFKFLLGHKAGNTEIASEDTQVFLQTAVKSGHIEIVKFLLDNKADVNAEPVPKCNRTALQAAAGGGHIEIVKFLLDKKADVNAEPVWGYGRTALQAASEGGHIDIVKLLLENKADINAGQAPIGGLTALQAAARGGNINIVKLLLDNKADVNAEPAWRHGRTTLQAAAECGHTNIVKLLLDNKATADEKSPGDGQTALKAAIKGGHTDIIKLLLSKNVGIYNGVEMEFARNVLEAVRGGHAEENKANVNARPANSYQGLSVSERGTVWSGSPAIVEIFSVIVSSNSECSC